MPLIYIAGLSGSGKSSLTKLLQKQHYEAHDADVELCKWFNNTTGEQATYPRNVAERSPTWHQQHSFVMSEQLIAGIAKRSKEETIFILGIAPNDLAMARKYFDNVLFLYTSKAEMVRRVTARTTNTFGRDADQLAVIKKWYQPTIDKYNEFGARFINAEQPIQKVLGDILASLPKVAPKDSSQ